MDQKALNLLGKTASLTGDDFFKRIVIESQAIIHSDYTFIARVSHNEFKASTIALMSFEGIISNFDYSLKDTPCANVVDDSVCCYPNHVCELFPHDQLLIDMSIKGYIGSPLKDSAGNIIGILVALYHQPMQEKSFVHDFFQGIAGRVASELENTQRIESLEKELAELRGS